MAKKKDDQTIICKAITNFNNMFTITLVETIFFESSNSP